MSYKISNLVAELPREIVNGTQLAVLRAIADRAGDGGVCFSSYRDLADRCNFVKSVVRNAIDHLVEIKLITRERQERADSGADTTYNYFVEVLQIVEHVAPLVETWSERRREAWYEQTSWIEDWYPHETNQRAIPTQAWHPKPPKSPEGGAVSRHGGVPSPGTGGVPPESTGGVPSPGTHEAVSYEAVSDEEVLLNSPAAAPADAGLPTDDDQDFLVPPLETSVEEVTTYTREDARDVDPWEAVRGPEMELDLDAPQEDWTRPEQPAESISRPTGRPQDPRAGFHAFYSAFPRAVDRHRAEAAWCAARERGVDAELMIDCARAYAEECREQHTESRKIARPHVWLNTNRYNDFELVGVAA